MTGCPRVRVSGPLASFAAGFSDELVRSGYTPLSARLQLRLVAHLSRWLESEEFDAAALTLGCRRAVPGRASLRWLCESPDGAGVGAVAWLSARDRGGAAGSPRSPGTPVEALLGRYRRYLAVERGLTAGTVRGYVDVVRPFLAESRRRGRARAGAVDRGRCDRVRVSRLPGSARQGRLGEADGDRAAVAAAASCTSRA